MSLEKVELCSFNLLECLQQAYTGTLLQSASSASSSTKSVENDDDDDDAAPQSTAPKTSAESALDRLFADNNVINCRCQ